VRVHISIDMEGVAGVAAGADTMLGAPQYEYCRHLMTGECNAAIAGCFDAGATEVVVNDSHGSMLNLLQEELDERAKVVRGRPKPLGMMQALDRGMDATLFIGYHAAAGHGDGVLNHTMRGRDLLEVSLNGEMAGELRLNAAMAGWVGVPVALVSGDDVVCSEARQWLSGTEVVEVKEAIDKYTALSLHPERARQAIRSGTAAALKRLPEVRPYRVEPPFALRIGWSSTSIAAWCEGVPGMKRVSSREVEYVSGDYLELYRLLRVLLMIASASTGSPYSYD
jgi:D-amino peptidase